MNESKAVRANGEKSAVFTRINKDMKKTSLFPLIFPTFHRNEQMNNNEHPFFEQLLFEVTGAVTLPN